MNIKKDDDVKKSIVEIDQIIEMAKRQKGILNGMLVDVKTEGEIIQERRSFQTRCSKVINRVKVDNEEEYIEICGIYTKGSALINSKELIYRLDLCERHFNEFVQKEKEEE
ncbi:hypothetical protein LCGC14_0224870 [marine sediment metagenome]|uniref:Uncharacterized protein n=1 Tax=marine sediment metagenome TaxID=412755 RepID=A0A0F9XG84_9ZZZZ